MCGGGYPQTHSTNRLLKEAYGLSFYLTCLMERFYDILQKISTENNERKKSEEGVRGKNRISDRQREVCGDKLPCDGACCVCCH